MAQIFSKVHSKGLIKTPVKVGVTQIQQFNTKDYLNKLADYTDRDFKFVNSFNSATSTRSGALGDLMRGQIAVQNWSLKLNLVTRISEVAVSTIKKFQAS
jgi:hypothetical protein